jgi:hypothetical protein
MSTTLAIRRRRALAKRGIGMPGNNDVILAVARRLREPVAAPVLGGIAVYLHGYLRATTDLDLYTPDRSETDKQLRTAGARWDVGAREHVLDGVRIHTVTPGDAGHVVEKTSIIDGVRVVSLRDLIAIKLLCGLENVGRSKDIADVEELVRVVPLDKRFAGKLPPALRAPYKSIVDAVRANEKQRQGKPRF